jgi:tetratricopeptide (TPR) repeat protein
MNYTFGSRTCNQNGRGKRSAIFLISSVLLMLFVSCSQERSSTEKRRMAANPKAVQFLVSAEYVFKNGIYSAALAMTDSAIYYEPELSDIHFLRGLIYTELLQFDEAMAAYERVLALDSNYPGIHLNLGNTAFRRGDVRAALNHYLKENEASAQQSTLLQIARAYTALGQIDSARQSYEQTIAMDSSYATAYMRLAELHKDDGELDKALYFARKGLALEPDNVNYKYVLATIQLLHGQPEEAAGLLADVVHDRPWHYWANYNYGQALLRSEKPAHGQRYLAAAESLQAELKLIDDWRVMVENNPDQQGIWINYGDVLARSGRIEDAIHAHNVALSLGPPYYLALQSNLATLYMLHGDTAKALDRYFRILKYDSTYADAWLNLGVAYAKAGKKKQAQYAWKNAQKYAPDDSVSKVYLERLAKEDGF